jgi:hypothetical protein
MVPLWGGLGDLSILSYRILSNHEV